MFLSAEMMLPGVAINLVAFARYHGNLHGQVFVLFIVAVAACEAAMALAADPDAVPPRQSLDVVRLAGAARVGVPSRPWTRSRCRRPPPEPYPQLAPAGVEPPRPRAPGRRPPVFDAVGLPLADPRRCRWSPRRGRRSSARIS